MRAAGTRAPPLIALPCWLRRGRTWVPRASPTSIVSYATLDRSRASRAFPRENGLAGRVWIRDGTSPTAPFFTRRLRLAGRIFGRANGRSTSSASKRRHLLAQPPELPRGRNRDSVLDRVPWNINRDISFALHAVQGVALPSDARLAAGLNVTES